MSDIFDEISTSASSATSGGISGDLVTNKEVNKNEDQKPSKPQAYQEGNARRVPDQQEPSIGSKAGLQANGMLRSQDQSQRQRNDQADLKGDIFDQLEKGGVGSERQTQDAQGGIQGAQAGQGMEGQVPARNQAAISGAGVQASPSSKSSPMVAGLGSFFEGTVGLLSGLGAGAIALPAAVAAGVPSAGLGAMAVEAGAFLGGSYLGKKAAKRIEEYFGLRKTIEEAQKESPIVSTIAETVPMLPQLAESTISLGAKALTGATKAVAKGAGAAGAIAGGAKAVSKPLAVGAGVGAAFEPARYGVEQTLNFITGGKDKVDPVTMSSLIQSSLFGAAMGGVGGAKAQEQLKKTGLPETGKAVSKIDILNKAKEVASDPEPEVEAAYRRAQKAIANNDPATASQQIQVAKRIREQVGGSEQLEKNRSVRDEYLTSLISELPTEPVKRFEENTGKPITLEPITPEAPPAEAIPEPQPAQKLSPSSKTGSFISKSLTSQGVDKEVADHFAALVEEKHAGKKPEDVRADALREFEEAGGKLPSGAEKEPEDASYWALSFPEETSETHAAYAEQAKINNADRIKAINDANKKILEIQQKPAEAKAEAQPTKPSEKEQVQGPSGLSVKQGVAPVGEAEVKTEGGVTSGERKGKEEVAPKKGARIKAAAYVAPDGKTYEGPDHLAAMKVARDTPRENPAENKAWQDQMDAEIASKQDPKTRNTDKFGYNIINEDGSISYKSRDESEAIGRESGQVNLKEGETPEHGMLHSHETEKEDYPVAPKVTEDEKAVISGVAEKAKQDMGRPGAAALEEFRHSRMIVGAEKIFEGKGKKDEWMQAMKDDGYNDENGFTDSILNDIWRDATSYVNDFETTMRGGDVSVKQAIKTSVTGKASVKPTIENLRAKLRDSISKAQALGEYLRGMAKGAKYGKKAGIEEERARGQVKIEAIKQKLGEAKSKFEAEREAAKKQAATEKVAQRWHDADKNSIRKAVDELLFKIIPESGLRLRISDLKTFSRQLDRILSTPFNPKGGRMRDGEFVSTNEMMWERVDDLMKDIQQRADEVYASDLQKDIRSSVKKALTSPSVFADFKDQIRQMISGIDLKRLTPANEAKLRAKQEALAAEGKSLQASQAQRLLDLSKTDLKSLSIEELEALHNSILDAEKQGREKWNSIQEAKAAQEEQRLTDLAQDKSVKPRNEWEKKVRDTGVSGYQKIKDKLYNAIATGRNWLSVHEKARMFIPDMFKVLDGKENGWLYKNVYEPLITGIRQHGRDFNEVKEGAVNIARKYDLSENDFVKIFVHAHKMQGKDEGELLKFSNDKENLSKIINDYQSNGLTKGQQELYSYMRKKLDENVPSMLRFFADNYNKQLKLYDNYFPRSFDNRKSAWWKSAENKIIDPITGKEIDPNNVADGLMHRLEFPALTQSIRKGFEKARVEGAEIPLNLNAMEVFLNHMDDWHYVKNIQPTLNEAARMASSNVFAGKYGQVGKSLVLDYIDAMARRGKYARSAIEKGIDALRNISMVGTLGFRLSQFKHIANYPIGQKEAGGAEWWGRGLLAATKSQEGYDFIKKYMPEIFERSGGDVSVLEAARSGGKITKAAFIGDLSLIHI